MLLQGCLLMYRTQRYSDAIIVLLFEDNDSHLNSFKPINVGLELMADVKRKKKNRYNSENRRQKNFRIKDAVKDTLGISSWTWEIPIVLCK